MNCQSLAHGAAAHFYTLQGKKAHMSLSHAQVFFRKASERPSLPAVPVGSKQRMSTLLPRRSPRSALTAFPHTYSLCAAEFELST